MTLDDAVRHLAAMADVKRTLAAAPRTSALSRSIAHKHRVDVEAIDVVLSALRGSADNGEA